MTDKRTTIVLSILASALLAYIVAFERDTLSTSDLSRRAGQVLAAFVRDRVTRVEVARGAGGPIVLERGETTEEGELGTWALAEPVRADADDDAVEGLLSTLEWLTPERTLERITEADRARFGLAEPRFVVRFQVGAERVTLRVGGRSTQPEGVYVGVEGGDRAYVVAADLEEALDHEVDHFRDKEIFPSDFFSVDANRLRLEQGGAALVFEKEGPAWQVLEPLRGLANEGTIDAALRVTRELRAERFIAEDARDLGRFGLDRPSQDLVVTRPDTVTGTREVHLRVGGPCAGHPEERYAMVGDRGPVVCVLASAVAGLSLEPADARETRLSALAPDAVAGITIEAQGAPRVRLEREESGWRLAEGPGSPAAADTSAVEEWLRQLRDQRALSFEPIENAAAHGLEAPSATLTLRAAQDGPAAVIRVGAVGTDGVWARRGEEPALLRVDASAGDLLRPAPLRFRDRAVIGRDAADARRVVVRRSDLEERAVRDSQGEWQLETPLTAEADRVVVPELVRQFAELRAERFVAEQAAAEHGLDSPRLTVSVTFEPPEGEPATVTLRVGASTITGAYAQVEGQPAVFEVTQSVLDALNVSLLSLDLLSVDLTTVESIRIERDGERVADLRRDGPRWLTAEGSPSDGERTRELLEQLVGLRADGVRRYGDDSELSEASASTRVVIGRAAGELTIAIGEDTDGAAPVRGNAVAATYRFRADAVRVFRTYVP